MGTVSSRAVAAAVLLDCCGVGYKAKNTLKFDINSVRGCRQLTLNIYNLLCMGLEHNLLSWL